MQLGRVFSHERDMRPEKRRVLCRVERSNNTTVSNNSKSEAIYNLYTPFWRATEFSNPSNPSLSSESSSIRRRFKHYNHPASSPMYTLTHYGAF